MLTLPNLLQDQNNLRPFQVKDNTMSSKFRRGDVAIVDVTDLRVWEGYNLFEFFGESAIYRVTRGIDKVILSKDDEHSAKHEMPIDKARDHVLGRVVGAVNKL